MKKSLILGLVILIPVLACSSGKKKVASDEPWESEPCNTCSIVHKPHVGCPKGTKESKGFFQEKDGSHLDACFRDKGDGAMDVLMPGEGAGFSIQLQVDDPPTPQPKS